jgi:hypothetical protein
VLNGGLGLRVAVLVVPGAALIAAGLAFALRGQSVGR